jgi:hypothetical protein
VVIFDLLNRSDAFCFLPPVVHVPASKIASTYCHEIEIRSPYATTKELREGSTKVNFTFVHVPGNVIESTQPIPHTGDSTIEALLVTFPDTCMHIGEVKAPTQFAQLFSDMFSFSSQPPVHIVRRSPKKNHISTVHFNCQSRHMHYTSDVVFNKQICILVMYEHGVKSCKLSGQNSV